MSDPINPQHYDNDACMKAIAIATRGLEGEEAFCTGNAIKYLWRWKRKGGKDDIKKAIWYLQRMLGEEQA